MYRIGLTSLPPISGSDMLPEGVPCPVFRRIVSVPLSGPVTIHRLTSDSVVKST